MTLQTNGNGCPLWLVRHGQTDWNVEGRWQGQVNPPLNSLGRKQTILLIEQMVHVNLQAVFSSDLDRAYETAQAVAGKKGLEVKVDPRLREISLGEWEGLTSDEIARIYPTEWQDRIENPLEARAPGGESILDLAGRVIPVVWDICRMYPAGRILIVSHGLALAVLLCHIRGLPLEQAFGMVPMNATPIPVDWMGLPTEQKL